MSSGLIGRTVRTTHITSSPFCLKQACKVQRLTRTLSFGERDRDHVCLFCVGGVFRKEHKDLTVSQQRKSKCSFCGNHSNVAVGLTHQSAMVHTKWLKAHNHHSEWNIHVLQHSVMLTKTCPWFFSVHQTNITHFLFLCMKFYSGSLC